MPSDTPTKPDNPVPDDLPIPYPSNRIERTTVADQQTDAALAPISPTGSAVLSQTLIRVATGVVAVAALVVGLSLPPISLAIPAAIVGICGTIVAIGTVLGISSQGVRAPAPPAVPPKA